MKNANGTGTVYKLKGKRRFPWAALKTVKWETNGKKAIQKRILIGTFSTKSEATNALINYNPNKIKTNDEILFKEIFEKWFQLHKTKISERTLKIYNSMINKYLVEIFSLKFVELKYEFWQEFANKITAKSSLLTVKAILKGIYSYAIKIEIVSTDYSAYIETGKIEKKVQRKLFTETEIEILWNNSEDKWVASILILLYSGLRIREFLKLKIENVDFNENYFITGSKTKAGKGRYIPIHPKIKPLLEKLATDKGKFLFMRDDKIDITYDYYRKIFNRRLEALEISEHTIHDTRHTFISKMDKLGVNKVALQNIVGHSDIKTTQKFYIHKNEEDLKIAIEKLKY
ncbi:MAG: site-specific integrase [Fusobacterium sp.]|nr:site-specific integrase [Fusobacterium sp.]